MRIFKVMIAIGLLLMMQQCKVTYSFSGVNISPEVQTYSVDYFPNRAPIVQAQLSQLFTDALMDKATDMAIDALLDHFF